MRLLLATVAAVLVAPAVAWGGGFATVGLSSLPDGAQPGRPWNVELTVMAHGRTPVDELEPAVVIVGEGTTRTFAARPAGRPGTYRASVVFPGAGRWSVAVEDGYSMRHSFAPVQVGAPASAAPAPGRPVWPAFGAALVAGLLAGLVAHALGRRRSGAPAPA